MTMGRERERELDRLLGRLREVELGDLRFLEVLATVRDFPNARRPAAGPSRIMFHLRGNPVLEP